MTKTELVNELCNNTYVMLKPSPIAGIGVFAIRDIPAGCREMFSKPDINEKWIPIPRQEVETMPQPIQFLIGNYCLYDENNYFVPDHGFKKVDLSFFLNHSENFNIRSINEGEYFEAIQDIKAGDELFIDYGDIVDH